MKQQRKSKFFILNLITIGIVLSCWFGVCYYVKAFGTGESDKNEAEALIVLKAGNISIQTINNKKASTPYRWKTVGFVITKNPIPCTTTSIQNYIANESNNDYIACFKYDKHCKTYSTDQGDGTYKCKYQFENDYVIDQIKKTNRIELDNITHSVPLYIHFIFRTFYTGDDGKTQVDLSGDIYNWSEIANYYFDGVGTWGAETRDDFYKYYNLKFEYKPGPQHNKFVRKLLWSTGTEQKLDEGKLASGYCGDIVSWKVEDEVKYTTKQTKRDYLFRLKGYYIVHSAEEESGQGTSKHREEKQISKKITVDQIKKGSYEIPFGGFTIYFLYEQVVEKEPNYYQFEDESGSIINNMSGQPLKEVVKGEKLTWSELNLKKYYVKKDGSWYFSNNYSNTCSKVYQLKTYYSSENKTGVIKKKEEKYTVEQIKSASIESVPKGGVTIHLVFQQLDSETNYYQFEDEDGNIINNITKMSLGKKNIGESLSWKQVDLNQYYICKSNKWYMSETKDGNATAVYELQSYDITSNLDDTYDYIGEKQTVYQIKKGTYIVEKGGHTVHFVFKLIKVTKKPDNYYQFEDEDGNIINGIQNKSLGKKKVGDRLSWNHLDLKQYYVRKNTKWSMSDTYETSWKEVYKLIRYEITSNMSGECLYKSKVISVSKIINSTYKVCEGGITVHFIFQVIKSGGDPSGSPEITDSKEPQPSGEINPDIPTIPMPAAEQVEQEFDQEPAVCGRIEADKRNQEYFIVQEKIPTTESTYVEVKGKQYLLGYEFTKVVGTKTYNVPVTVQYTLEWNDIKQQTIMSQEVSVMDVVTVTRPYAYWVIDNIDYYTIDSAYVTNKVLPEGHVLIKADASANVIPTLQVKHTNAVMDHIQDPSNVNGVYIDGGIISGGVTKPMPPNKSFTAEVEAQVGNILARNDSVEFNGVCIMDDSFYPVEGKSLNHLDVINQRAEVCGEDVLFKQDNVIPSSLLNDRYASGGSVTYRRVTSINSKLTDTVTYLIPSINDVVVHTPVVCDVKVEADNQSYNQLIAPRGNCTSIVLDESRELNDMDIMISNTGTHSYYKGYSMRDFSHSIRDPIHASYIAQSKGEIRNEIMFPFDVYRVNEDGKESYIVKNTWIVIGRKKVKFFVPMWVDEGVYTVRCRSIAINATEDLLSNTEEYANVNPNNYVATNQFQVEISGRIYGLHIYDISEYPLWEKVFREDKSLELRLNHPDTYPLGTNSNQYDNKKSYSYTVGVNDSYGKKTNRKEKYTIPLVDGNHPIYENQGIFKSGYAVRFGIETTGNMFVDKTQIRIRPTFWYVDKNGKNRTEVDLYYTEEVTSDNQTQYSNSNDSSNQLRIQDQYQRRNGSTRIQRLVKIGSARDQVNMKCVRTGDPYLGIPKEELIRTALIRGASLEQYVLQYSALFHFAEIRSNPFVRTYCNDTYLERIHRDPASEQILKYSTSDNEIKKRKQRYYFEYYIPGNVKVVRHDTDVKSLVREKGINYQEDCWLKNGYLIVNLDIVTVDENGRERLSYINKENYLKRNGCCMWLMEGAKLNKTDSRGTEFEFKVGDAFVYDLDHSLNTSYKVEGIY